MGPNGSPNSTTGRNSIGIPRSVRARPVPAAFAFFVKRRLMVGCERRSIVLGILVVVGIDNGEMMALFLSIIPIANSFQCCAKQPIPATAVVQAAELRTKAATRPCYVKRCVS